MNKTLTEKIRYIVLDAFITGETEREANPVVYGNPDYFTNKLRSLFEEMGESLIGKNEEMTGDYFGSTSFNTKTNETTSAPGDMEKLYKNKLRSEQRIKLKELLGN